MRHFLMHIYDPQIPDPSLCSLSLSLSPVLLHSACRQTRQQITEDVMLMAGSSTEAPGQHRQPGGSYLLTNGIWCWAWAALTGGFYWLKEHDIMAVFFSMPLWQSGWRCREQRHLVTQRCRVLLNRWQETSEESGNGQQMEKRSAGEKKNALCIPDALPVHSSCTHTHTQFKHLSLTSTFSLCLMFWVKFETKGICRINA